MPINPFETLAGDSAVKAIKQEIGIPEDARALNKSSVLYALLQQMTGGDVASDISDVGYALSNLAESRDPNLKPYKAVYADGSLASHYAIPQIPNNGRVPMSQAQADSISNVHRNTISNIEKKYDFIDDEYESDIFNFIDTADSQSLRNVQGIYSSFIKNFWGE